MMQKAIVFKHIFFKSILLYSMLWRRLSARSMLISLRSLVVLSLLLFVTACDSIGYYSQAAKGQLSLLASRQPIDELIASDETDPELKAQLVKAQEILSYAKQQGLPVEKAYSQYVDLHKPYVVWNVFAAAKDSVDLLNHCFPIAGCVGYRGFFAQADAEEYASSLERVGYDVYVGGVSAYSTLGWFNDPLLNTFLFRSDERLAAVLFHELAHRALYLEGDTVFNESFATSVELHLLKKWLGIQERAGLYEAYAESQQRRSNAVELILSTRQQLVQAYALELSEIEKEQEKSRLILELRANYETLRTRWGEGGEFSSWMAQELNNAHFGAIGAYQAQVPGFTNMLNEHVTQGKTLVDFFDSVRLLSKQPKEQRDAALGERSH